MIRFPFFRGGVCPSPLTALNMQKLTGTQKLDLIRCRIFGEMIGGNHRSGYSAAKRGLSGIRRLEYYTLLFEEDINPFIKPFMNNHRKRFKYFKTMKRNAMRGIKLSKKRGGLVAAAVSQFGQIKKSTPESDKGKKDKKGKGNLLFNL